MDSAGSVHGLLARFERAKAAQGPGPLPGQLVTLGACGPILIHCGSVQLADILRPLGHVSFGESWLPYGPIWIDFGSMLLAGSLHPHWGVDLIDIDFCPVGAISTHSTHKASLPALTPLFEPRSCPHFGEPRMCCETIYLFVCLFVYHDTFSSTGGQKAKVQRKEISSPEGFQ